MEELFVYILVAWVVASTATLFAVAHLGGSVAARAVLGGTVGAIVGVVLEGPGQASE
jgi:membrane associated rhomboid family serine protease